MSYSTLIVSRTEEFAALEARWDDLVSAAADANTFLSHAWLYAWWSAYRPTAQLRLVLVERAGRLCGIAPMMLLREGGVERLLRRLRFVGDGTSETDHMNFIVRRDDRPAILAALLAAVEDLDWDVAHFSQMPEGSANTAQLLEYAADRGWLLDSRSVPCPRRSLPQSYDELLRSLPSRLRTAIRSGRRDLEARFRVDFGSYKQQEELPGALELLYSNHAGRWQAKGEQGVFVKPRKRDFYARLSAKLLEAGALRFYFLKLDGEVVAQQFCFEHSGTVFLLQEGFDIAYARQNVGNVLRAMVFERLIAEGMRTYDFLAGVSRHKQSWSDSLPNDVDVRAFRPSLMGRLAGEVVRWKKLVQRRGLPVDRASD